MEVPWYTKWQTQVKLLLWKNYRVALRNKKSTIVQFISPIFFIFTLFLFQVAIQSASHFGEFYKVIKESQQKPVLNIPQCVVGSVSDFCYTFAYAPNDNPDVLEIVKKIQQLNVPQIPDSSVRGFATAADVDDFLFNNPNSTQAAILFEFLEPNTTLNETLKSIEYTLQVNTTDSYSHGIVVSHQEKVMIPMQFAIDRAILKFLSSNSSLSVAEAELDVDMLTFPHYEVESVNIIGDNGPVFFFAALIVNFVISLGQIVTEKELKLRESMKIMGLYDSAYWLSWFLTMLFFNTMTVFLMIAAGCAFQFTFFLKNNFGLYFLLLELFAITLIGWVFLVSTIVKKADTATSLGFGMFFLGYFLQVGARVVFSSGASGVVRGILALLSPSILQVGLTNLGSATQKSTFAGLSWSSVNDTAGTEITTITFAEMYGWLILDFFIYLVLALYLDNVLPNEYGTRRPFYYFLQPSYWTGKVYVPSKDFGKKLTTDEEFSQFDEDVKDEEKLVFDDKLPKNTPVVLKNLCKIYERSAGACSRSEQFPAVKDLSFHIEENTLFCLLGPNGAGKTTTIHMLVGFHEATHGEATIFNYSIRDQISQIQSIMGLCPQFDILWHELTGEEHLELFAGLKNLPADQVKKEVAKLIDEVGLRDESHVRTAMYSGGMRRRLSVAIALIGNPKIVIMDEPTTGMDPVSRREVWNVIERAKKNRVVILTTHSMEEADVLGDNIGIVAKGRLQCIGTALHLKQKYGAGYTISVGTTKVPVVRDFFSKLLPEAKLTAPPLSGYLHYSVSSNAPMVSFFKQLEEQTEELGITDCQLSITTLEQVFLKVAENSELDPQEVSINNNSDKQEEPVIEDAEAQTTGVQANTEGFSLKDQFVALFIKTAKLQSRDHKTNACQILTPFVFISILLGFQVLINSIVDAPEVLENRHPDINYPFHILSWPPAVNPFDPNGPVMENLGKTNGVQLVYASAATMDVNAIGDYYMGTGILGAVEPTPGTSFDTKFLAYSLDPTVSQRAFGTPSIPLPFSFKGFDSKGAMDKQLLDDHYTLPYIAGGYYFKKADFVNNQFSYSVVFNYTETMGEDVPYLMSHITNAIAKRMDNPYRVVLKGVKPFPTAHEGKYQVDIMAEGGTITYTLILHQLLPVFMTNIVSEKESKIRELMKMTGMKMSLYWLVHYLFDYFMYLVITAILIISGEIYSVRFFTINDFATYYIMFLLWGHTLIALSFLLSVFFNSKKTSSVVGYVLVIAIGLFTYVLLDNLLGDFDNTPSNIRVGVSVIPSCALYRGFMYLTAEVRNKGPGYRLADIDNEVVSMSSVYGALAIQWAVMMIMWLYLEQIVPSDWGIKKHPLFFLGMKSKVGHHHHHDSKKELPQDAMEEYHQVFSPHYEKDFAVRVLDLKKMYPASDGNPPKLAVKGVSFGLHTNSCIGVLGHNGAGKTTLLNVLIGLYPPTHGTAVIHGNKIEENLSAIHTIMGVCTQYDILWDNLTGREHLQFYGRLRNLKGKELDDSIDQILKQLNLFEAGNVLATKYSGGMKRRLSVAIALLGFPKVIFLDEPSTGLDPKSRQRMWRLINEAKQKSSIILTTHSMEEADAICDRLLIMSEGEVKCIGASADLKGRFGEGLKLSVQVAKGYDEALVHDYISKSIPSARLLNSLSGTSNYQIAKGAITLDKAFELMQSKQDELHITDWAITHTTLEEVFLKISEHDSEPVVETNLALVQADRKLTISDSNAIEMTSLSNH